MANAETKKEKAQQILRLAKLGFKSQWGSEGEEALNEFEAHVDNMKDETPPKV